MDHVLGETRHCTDHGASLPGTLRLGAAHVNASRSPSGRRRRTSRRRTSGKISFEREVQGCARELALIRPLLLADYSAAAVAAALAIHAVRSLADCVRAGTITHRHARSLIQCMAELKMGLRDLR